MLLHLSAALSNPTSSRAVRLEIKIQTRFRGLDFHFDCALQTITSRYSPNVQIVLRDHLRILAFINFELDRLRLAFPLRQNHHSLLAWDNPRFTGVKHQLVMPAVVGMPIGIGAILDGFESYLRVSNWIAI